jgi:hypothetical protein
MRNQSENILMNQIEFFYILTIHEHKEVCTVYDKLHLITVMGVVMGCKLFALFCGASAGKRL